MSTPRKRIRLSPALRSGQILDAALVEFSAHGFAATRMEDIARRAGLSKAGLYAHYPSKDAIFESLLVKVLNPSSNGLDPETPARATLADRVDAFLERIYARLEEPDVAAVFRLLIAEGHRVPQLVRLWERNVMERHYEQERMRLAQGRDCDSVFRENPSLLYAPALYVLVWRTMFGDAVDAQTIASMRSSHRRMLLALIQAPARADAAECRSEGPVPVPMPAAKTARRRRAG